MVSQRPGSAVDEEDHQRDTDEEMEQSEGQHGSEDGSEDDEDDEEDGEEDQPPYSVEEITECILKFYKFLTTIHFSADDLLIPPASGWQHIPDIQNNTTSKSDLVLTVLKHLPYFKGGAKAQIHYKSRVKDFSALGSNVESYMDEYFADILPDLCEGNVEVQDILIFAEGHESGGRTLVLIPKTGEIIEEVLRHNTLGPFDVVEFFNTLRDQYRKLELIGGVGRNVIEAEHIPDTSDAIKLEDTITEASNQSWTTDVNVQYLRQVYRRHGWPDTFNRTAASDEVDKWMNQLVAEGKDTWETDFVLG